MPGGYGSNYSGPGFYDSSGFEQFVGGTLSGAEGGLNLVTKIRDRKKKEERDTADEKRRADAAKRQQEEFERRQDEAGYERGGEAADRMDQLGEGMQDMPGGSITRMAGDLIAGNLRKYPDRWVKSKESKDEKAQRLREGTSVEVARVRAEAAADLERERQGWRDKDREDKQAAAAALEAERARSRADLVAQRLLLGGGDTREEKKIQHAEKALEFAQTRRDRTMTRTPKEKDFTDEIGEVDVPRFEAAKRGFSSDSTRVEHELSRREAAYSKAIGEKPSAEPAEPPPNTGKQLSQSQHAALQSRFDQEAADFQEALRHIKDPTKREQARQLYDKRVAEIARGAGQIP